MKNGYAMARRRKLAPFLNSELRLKLSMQRDSNKGQAGLTTGKIPISYSACPMLLRLNYIRLAHAFIQLFGYDKRRGLTRNAF